MKNLNIIIKGAIGNYNFGDDLLTYSICNHLNQINIPIEITIISESNYLLNHIENINIIKYYKLSGVFDILIYAGGTQFASFGKRKNTHNLIKRIIINFKNIRTLTAKIKNKIFGQPLFKYKNLAIIGIGIGPFKEKDRYYTSTIKLLKESNLLFVRDSLSSKICEENQLNFSIGSDLVYSIPETFWSSHKKCNEKIKKIGVIIRDWNFSEEMSSFIYKLISINFNKSNIQFYSFCKVNDKFSINFLKENGFNESLTIWNPNKMSFQEFIKAISENDILLTARYHGAIIASLLGIPFISIGIEPKLKLIAELFEMPCWLYPYDIDDCLYKIQNIENNYKQEIEKIALITEKEKNKNELMMSSLNKLLNEL